MEFVLRIRVTAGDGRGSADIADVANAVIEELLDGMEVDVETLDGDGERVYVVSSVERIVVI